MLEALSLSGDLTDFANRQNIILMRQSTQGISTITLDLTQTETLYSPYFYLAPNDLIYIPRWISKQKEPI
jgi:polysaccharide export outer membrane protein